MTFALLRTRWLRRRKTELQKPATWDDEPDSVDKQVPSRATAAMGGAATGGSATTGVTGSGRGSTASPQRTTVGARTRSPGASELNDVLIQIQEVSREVEARLDTRIRYARRLMEESEEVLRKLEVENARARDLIEGRGMAGESRNVTASRDPGPRAESVSAETSPNPAQQRSETADVPAGSAPAEPPAEPGREIPVPDRERIESLAVQGRSPEEIATAVGRPVGEVELILALGRQEQEG